MTARPPFREFPELLAELRARPGMYLGGKSVRNLNHLLSGFDLAEMAHEIPPGDRLGGFDWEGFERWVQSRSSPNKLNANSFYLAAHGTGSDEAGFDRWFEWYDAFRREQPAPGLTAS